jgi:hypothetical protein
MGESAMSRLFSLAICGFAAALVALAALASGDDSAQAPRQKIQRDKAARQDKERIPAQRKDPEARGSASTGASVDPAAGGTDLGAKADKEDEEFRKKQGKRAQ